MAQEDAKDKLFKKTASWTDEMYLISNFQCV